MTLLFLKENYGEKKLNKMANPMKYELSIKMSHEEELRTYCYRCHKKTKTEDAEYLQNKNGKLHIRGFCSVCTMKKRYSFLLSNENAIM